MATIITKHSPAKITFAPLSSQENYNDVSNAMFYPSLHLPLCILVRKRLLLLTLHKIHSTMPEIVDLRKPEAFQKLFQN